MLAGNCDRRRIDDMALDPVLLLQGSIDPESIQSGFLNHHKRKKSSFPSAGLVTKTSETAEQARNIATLNRVARHLLASG
ncbi:hypothetical protein SXCC_00679 [Gluconacetobacter sp. SXCC-1]|nr:hypothetical protein SXCC_04837 [Gluconacetobacter sp. SXCC-1]EGG76606.1 hypothetical protein SXCC_02852 [Gluconacetobacter sp. SXCC-1]EGG76757.1 hypothetical protein SXCC_02682 [Gluconacetobacter sp. SXCC-1]EGG77270.1 hypothetical protein SXCC_02482 [Gluconacetobacter sp. SXCC-1]EGG77919.1 hypothetical protein SXCC_01311 [Gluconacetobacter sp. SXCC-1]